MVQLNRVKVVFYSVISTLVFSSIPAQAQVLEEIVVTAQRRTQSLQDVPISIDLYSSDEILKEGYNNLEELSAFAPGVFVQEGTDQGSDVFIRGFGTVGRNWANDSATPMFLDNINLGQASMGALSFMDVQQVEILKGPQPIHFGMNATAGALSIVSARPTADWEGYVNAEFGQSGEFTLFKRSGDKQLDGAISGPISDTLRFRLAGRYNTSDGFLRDAVTLYPLSYRNFLGGRAMLDWTPTDRLTILGKMEVAQQNWTSANRVCERTGLGDLPNRFERNDDPSFDDVETDPTAMWLDYADGGVGWATPTAEVPECQERYNYIGQTEVVEAPPVYIRTRDTVTGFMDIRLVTDRFMKSGAGGNTRARSVTFGESDWAGFVGDGTGTTDYGYQAGQSMKPLNFLVDVNYQITDSIEVQWTNGFMTSEYRNLEPSRNTPLLETVRNNVEDYEQLSSEIRIASYGGGMFEWMVGAFIQKEELDFSTMDNRAEIRFNLRFNENYQESTWTSYFGNLTFNFLDNRASIDAGLRYSRAKKQPTLVSYNGSWIFDVVPCSGRAGANPDIWKGDTTDWGGLPVQDVTEADCVNGVEPEAERIDAADAMFLLDTVPGRDIDLDNLWFVPRSNQRATPSTWRSPYTVSVGVTPWSMEQRAGEQWTGIEDTWDNLDPQIVFRYRPNPQLSLYAKYASAFKAGGYDLGFGTGNAENFDELAFDPEFSETFEFGASGSYWDGRGRFQATLFRVDFEDLIATTITNPLVDTQGTQIVNIGEQRSQGLELDTQVAVTDQLTTSVNFAYLDSKLTHFPNASCTELELRNSPESGCELIGPPGEEVPLIDRSGQTAAYSPKWSVAGNVDYWMPFRGYKVDMGARVTLQDWYYTDFRGFSLATIQDTDPDLNLHIGIGEMNNKWRVGLAFRNLLEPRSTFRPEHTSNYSALSGESLRSNQVKSFALTFNYNFFQ